MAFIAKGGVLALAMLMLASPAVVCIGPVVSMSADKCCQPQMMDKCGRMQLPSANSCCAAPSTPEQNSRAATATTAPLHLPLIAHIVQLGAHDIASQFARSLSAGDSPPASPPASVLRI